MRLPLLLLALTAVCGGILPEIVHPGISHVEDYYGRTEQNQLGDETVDVEQRSEDLQQHTEDAVQPETESIGPDDDRSSDLENSIGQACVSAEDCAQGTYCLQNAHSTRCQPCKSVDVPCTKDEECCDGQLCVWGQCSPNATRGDAGSTCWRQSDCGPDLCCAFHAVLLFPVCLAKPIERERCFGGPNHVMELLSWDARDEGPRKHCPCAGVLQCQHLGRGSMCLKEEDSSEEDLADSFYSDIDYII